jgi:hypothetical protein
MARNMRWTQIAVVFGASCQLPDISIVKMAPDPTLIDDAKAARAARAAKRRALAG